MSSMIERVGQSIANVIPQWMAGDINDADLACAAIEAMMEGITPAMVEAWASAEWPDEDQCDGQQHFNEQAATADFQAMLAAALADAPGEG